MIREEKVGLQSISLGQGRNPARNIYKIDRAVDEFVRKRLGLYRVKSAVEGVVSSVRACHPDFEEPSMRVAWLDGRCRHVVHGWRHFGLYCWLFPYQCARRESGGTAGEQARAATGSCVAP